MTGSETLRKENQSALRNEIADLKGKLQKISEDFSSKKAFFLRCNGNYNKTMIEIRIIVTEKLIFSFLSF